MREDVSRYMRYYNVHRLHSANDDLSPVNFEAKNKIEAAKSEYRFCEERAGSVLRFCG